jgi:hypothetical protein
MPDINNIKQVPYGTGTDPLGRYPKDMPYDPNLVEEPAIAEAIKHGWIELRDEEIFTEPDIHVPEVDHSGALRTDRPFTPAEAQALDARNRADQIQRRATRFVRKGV